jgi:hypothetical protein
MRLRYAANDAAVQRLGFRVEAHCISDNLNRPMRSWQSTSCTLEWEMGGFGGSCSVCLSSLFPLPPLTLEVDKLQRERDGQGPQVRPLRHSLSSQTFAAQPLKSDLAAQPLKSDLAAQPLKSDLEDTPTPCPLTGPHLAAQPACVVRGGRRGWSGRRAGDAA